MVGDEGTGQCTAILGPSHGASRRFGYRGTETDHIDGRNEPYEQFGRRLDFFRKPTKQTLGIWLELSSRRVGRLSSLLSWHDDDLSAIITNKYTIETKVLFHRTLEHCVFMPIPMRCFARQDFK
jgi:hypothetical protein